VLALELLDKVGDQAVAAGRSRRQESKKQLASDHDGKYWEAVCWQPHRAISQGGL
jgi:hypothetical protein